MFVGQGASHWPHMDPGLDGGLSHQDGIPHGRIDPRGGPSTLAKAVHSSVWGWVSLSWGYPEMSQSPLFKLYQLKVFSVAGTENPTKQWPKQIIVPRNSHATYREPSIFYSVILSSVCHLDHKITPHPHALLSLMLLFLFIREEGVF